MTAQRRDPAWLECQCLESLQKGPLGADQIIAGTDYAACVVYAALGRLQRSGAIVRTERRGAKGPGGRPGRGRSIYQLVERT